jgi:hypothetical protein
MTTSTVLPTRRTPISSLLSSNRKGESPAPISNRRMPIRNRLNSFPCNTSLVSNRRVTPYSHLSPRAPAEGNPNRYTKRLEINATPLPSARCTFLIDTVQAISQLHEVRRRPPEIQRPFPRMARISRRLRRRRLGIRRSMARFGRASWSRERRSNPAGQMF